MAIARVKTWGAEVLTFQDLNGEFDNILNNALALVSPWTGAMDANGNNLTAIGELAFNAVGNASVAGRLRRTAAGPDLTWHNGTVARLLAHGPVAGAVKLGVAFEASGGIPEVTTGSVSTVDLVVLTTSILTSEGFLLYADFRKDAGGAFVGRLGLKVNATTVRTATTVTSATNQVEYGSIVFQHFAQGTANHARSGSFMQAKSFDVSSIVASENNTGYSADFPNATLTTVTLTGSVNNAGLTLGVANLVLVKLMRS